MLHNIISFMRKIGLFLLALFLCACGRDDGCDDYRQAMRDFVVRISETARAETADFIVVPQNGIELVTLDGTADGVPATPYLAAIDGHGHGHGQGAAGDLGAFQGVGAGQGQRQHVSALRGQAHPHVAFLRPNGGGDGYEPRQQDEGDEDAEFLFHSSVYTIRRRKREYRWEFVDDSFAICPNIRVPQA